MYKGISTANHMLQIMLMSMVNVRDHAEFLHGQLHFNSKPKKKKNKK